MSENFYQSTSNH